VDLLAGRRGRLLYWVRDGSRERSGETRESPHEGLRRRLAQGEIGAEEYEQRKARLDRDPDAAG